MSHMVIYRAADGKPGYHQTDDIHDAVTFVEQMRNEEGVEHARIFRLEEVVFEYRPYYRVELTESGVPALDSGPANGTPSLGVGTGGGSTEHAGSGVDVVELDEATAGAVGQGDKKGLFGR